MRLDDTMATCAGEVPDAGRRIKHDVFSCASLPTGDGSAILISRR
jgi:hypothetical protein